MSYRNWKGDSSAPRDHAMQQGLFEVDFNFHFVLLSFTQGAESWVPEYHQYHRVSPNSYFDYLRCRAFDLRWIAYNSGLYLWQSYMILKLY